VRASESQAYNVLVRFFPCRVYINSSHHNTLNYEWRLVHHIHLVVCLVFYLWSKDGYAYDYIIIMIIIFTYL
jgi:hypothetical protein